MKLKSALVAASLILAVSAASATTVFDVGGATLTYDETTTLGSTNGSFNGFQFEGFSWQIPNSATLVNTAQGTTKNLSVNSKLSFRAALHAVVGRRHGDTKAS